jgi:hypothetical protein
VTPYLLDILEELPRPGGSQIAAHPKLEDAWRKLDSSITKLEGEQHRLAAYVDSRIASTDVAKAALAVTGGEQDVLWLRAELASHPCGKPAAALCVDRDLKLSGVADRIARCRDLSWLP